MSDNVPTAPPDIQSAAVLAKMIEASRAVHLGIALGEAADHIFSEEPAIKSGVATQLTLATTEAVIRCMERGGQSLPYDWEHETLISLGRWGLAQHIPNVISPRDGATPSFLSTLPGFVQRRGSAPATVRRLREMIPPGQLEASPKGSLGAHALIRTLPIGAVLGMKKKELTNIAMESAMVTHNHPLSMWSVAVAVNLVAAARDTDDLSAAWLNVLSEVLPEGHELIGRLGAAITSGVVEPCQPQLVKTFAPDRTAPSILAAAIYAVLSHPEPHQFPLAMGIASFTKDKDSSSAVTAALLAARNGSTSLLSFGAGRLELAWACEAMGTDLAMTAMLTPLGKEPSGKPWLPSWNMRY